VERDYVVEIDQDKLLKARRRVLRSLTAAGVTGLVGAGLILALAGGFALSLDAPVLLLNHHPAVILGAGGLGNLRRVRKLRAHWTQLPPPPVAMRLSERGLRMSIDAAPESVFLPWPAVVGFRRKRRLGRVQLVLDVAPGTSAATPGAEGLDHPDVQRVLRRRVQGMKGLRTSVRILRQPVGEIDAALAHFSGGRVRIH
jgi:hypothetical protein